MVQIGFQDKTQWLSLGGACRLLDVSDATLRHWADNGYLRVYRTPGGHRRFLRDDVLALTATGENGLDTAKQDSLEGSALRRIRQRLHRESVVSQPWYQSVEEEGRGRMRLFGRRLLSILAQDSVQGRQKQEVRTESHQLGLEYGSEMAHRGVRLDDTVEAFIFFRGMVLDSANPQTWNRIMELSDRVLVGVAESYQNHVNQSK